ncbi:hypothetical protein [Carboxydothermus ferrireducens]|uniref:Uncharacterized protein n=1 Tax=Carboxydothermus ferrireducens DSM 11255 TaxID=1119529 RepID=A0ABX2R7M1_9THEO|nr:hypothetical protein [Carboxydothermus ferrireducens]NYE57169.1 hypothetical protein [Carboxydothermus ferrireducens DSM 11255]
MFIDPISFYVTKVLFFAVVFVIAFERIKAAAEGLIKIVGFLKKIGKREKARNNSPE